MKLKLIFLLLISLITFTNALKSPFMLDDYAFFGSDRRQSLWSFFIPNRNAQLKLDSPQTDRAYYRPLAHVIPLMSYRIFGGNVMGHHSINLILMWLAACAIYVFLRSLRLNDAGLISTDSFAFWAAALFIVHPVNGILVNYITASVFSAQVVFMLMSLYCIQGCQCPSAPGSQQNNNWVSGSPGCWGACVFFILALLCHETAALLPLYALIVLRLTMPWRDCFRRIVPLLVILLLYFIFRSYASPFSKSILYSFSILDLTWYEKMATIFKLLSWYISKLFVPYSVFLMWSTPFVRNGTWFWIVGGLTVIVSLFTVSLLAKALNLFTAINTVIARSETTKQSQRAAEEIASLPSVARNDGGAPLRAPSSEAKHFATPVMTAFLLWFILGLTPIAAGAFVTPYVGGLVEPHWFVFGTIGFFAVVVLFMQKIQMPQLRNAILAILVGLFVVLSWRNNDLWSNEIPYYQAWLQEAPHFKAIHYFLGLAYLRNMEYDRAYTELEQSILGRYKDWMVYLELGQIDLKRRDLIKAEENITRAYKLESRHSGVLNAVGALLYKQGKLEKARVLFEQAINSNPYNLEPRMNLASCYRKTKQPDKAVQVYQELLKINPEFTPARKALQSIVRK